MTCLECEDRPCRLNDQDHNKKTPRHNSEEKYGWASEKLRKRMTASAILTILLCAESLCLGIKIAGIFRYGEWDFGNVLIIFGLFMMIIYTIKIIRSVLIEANWLWQIMIDNRKYSHRNISVETTPADDKTGKDTIQ